MNKNKSVESFKNQSPIKKSLSLSPEKFVEVSGQLHQVASDLSKNYQQTRSLKSTKNASAKATNYDSDNLKVSKIELSNRSIQSQRGLKKNFSKGSIPSNNPKFICNSNSLNYSSNRDKTKNISCNSKSLIQTPSCDKIKSSYQFYSEESKKKRNQVSSIQSFQKESASISSAINSSIAPKIMNKEKGNKSFSNFKQKNEKSNALKSKAGIKPENAFNKNINKLKEEQSNLIVNTLKKIPNIKKTLEKNLKRPLSAGIFN